MLVHDSHHLEDVDEVDREDDDVEEDVEFCSELNVLASQHAGSC